MIYRDNHYYWIVRRSSTGAWHAQWCAVLSITTANRSAQRGVSRHGEKRWIGRRTDERL